MSKLPTSRIQEFSNRYIESLERWIEIAIFSEEDLFDMLKEFNVDGRELGEYKRYVVENWPGIPSDSRLELKDPIVVNEIYQEILRANPILHPKNVWNSEVVEAPAALTDKELLAIRVAFQARDKRLIEVIQGNAQG